MKVYKASVEVQAVYYDGSYTSENEVRSFCRTARGVERVEKNKTTNVLFIRVVSQYTSVWIPLKKDSYVVKYPSNLIYPYKKAVFEKRFKVVET